MLDPFAPPALFVEPGVEVIEKTLTFTSVGDLFMFIGLLVCIGALGIYAMYRMWKDFF